MRPSPTISRTMHRLALRNDAVESRAGGRRERLAGGARGPLFALPDLLVPALRLPPPPRSRPGRCARPDAGVLDIAHRAAGLRGATSGSGPLPRVPSRIAEALPLELVGTRTDAEARWWLADSPARERGGPVRGRACESRDARNAFRAALGIDGRRLPARRPSRAVDRSGTSVRVRRAQSVPAGTGAGWGLRRRGGPPRDVGGRGQ